MKHLIRAVIPSKLQRFFGVPSVLILKIATYEEPWQRSYWNFAILTRLLRLLGKLYS